MIAAHHRTQRFSLLGVAMGCIAMALAPSGAFAGVAWHESYTSAQAASQASQRPVLVVFTASWCEACQHLDSRLWANQEAAALVTACYEPVLVDVDADPALARRLGISHIPSACVLNGNDQLLTTFDVPPTAATFVAQAARALHESTSTAVAPATTIASHAPTNKPQLAAQPVPAAAAMQPPAAASIPAYDAPQGRYDAAARYAQRPASPFGGSDSSPVAAPQQPPMRSSIDPAPQGPASHQQPPWLATSQAPAAPAQPTLQPSQAATFPPIQPPAAQPQPVMPQQGFSPYPQTPPRGQQAGYAAAPPAQTMTPYPTLPPPGDTAATATDRAAEESNAKSKSSWLSTLQKPFAFMMPKDSSQDDDVKADAVTAPSPYPVGLDGYCPVTLAEQATWTEGRAQWGVQHRGRSYLFTSATEQQRFLQDPDRYAPALSGDDVVLAFEAGNQIPGQRRYGVTYQGRIYLFSSLETRSRFAANPQAYASRVRLAENPGAAGGGTMLR
jgi:YHS domain-containing protein/thiol-disulfide isomerase/thioredoxin